MANKYYSSITKKQANVIYMTNKQGLINLSDIEMKYIYNHFVDINDLCNNNNQQNIYDIVKNAVNAIFDKNYELAQEELKKAFNLECVNFDSKDIRALKEVL